MITMIVKDIIVGLDGGATSTKCVIADMEGHILARGIGGPSNQGYGEERKKKLRKALSESLKPALNSLEGQPYTRSFCLGMTGLNVGEMYNLIKDTALELLNPKKIKILGDMQIAFRGASLGQPGIIIYAGTGTNCYGEDENGNIANVSGWGYIIDDEGAGYDIGRRALRALFREYDGRGRTTLLTKKILNYFSCDSPVKLCQKIYSYTGMSRSEIGNLAPLITEAVAEGDDTAKQILNRASKELALCVTTLVKRLVFKNKLRIYPCGGVFKTGHFILDPFKEEISKEIKNFSINTPSFNPDIGALFIAAEEINIKIDSEFIQNLNDTYN